MAPSAGAALRVLVATLRLAPPASALRDSFDADGSLGLDADDSLGLDVEGFSQPQGATVDAEGAVSVSEKYGRFFDITVVRTPSMQFSSIGIDVLLGEHPDGQVYEDCYITWVSDVGLIPGYNKHAPNSDEVVTVGDVVTKVSWLATTSSEGQTFKEVSGNADEINKALTDAMGVVTITILRPIEDISEFKYFEINPSTIGAEKLGMLVGHEAARKECVVEWIQDGGMLSLYNQKNPSQALRVGDSIVQVNNVVGVRFDAAAMHEELQRSHSVTFKIRFKRKKHAVSYETGLEDCPSHVEVSQSSSQPRGELLVYLGIYDRVSEVPDYLKSSRPFYQSRKDGENLMWHYLWYSQEARAWQIGDPGTDPRYAVVLVSSPSGQHATCPFEVQKGMWAEYFVSLDHESSNGSTWKTNPGIQVLPVESV